MERKVISIRQNVFLSYEELSNINPNSVIFVTSDDFFDAYPKLVKSKADLLDIKRIYMNYVNKCISRKAISIDDRLAMRAGDAVIYFKNAQNFINSQTFRDNSRERTKKILFAG